MLEIFALYSIFRAVVNAEVHTHSDGCTNICLKEGLDDLPDDIHCQDDPLHVQMMIHSWLNLGCNRTKTMCGQLLFTHRTVSSKMTAPAQLSAHLNVLFKCEPTPKRI